MSPLCADLAVPCLGLETAQYSQLLRSTTHIIHNAWLVDFNQPLSYFASNLQGVSGLIEFAAGARCEPRIFFISSVSSVFGLEFPTLQVPETIQPINETTDQASGSALGYAQSKRAAELLLARAGELSQVKSAICRVGQIGGTSSAGQKTKEGRALPSWQARDWLPRLLVSSKHLGVVPDSLGSLGGLDWTPIDHVAKAVVEMVEESDRHESGKEEPLTQVFHLTNPAKAPGWQALLPVIKKEIGRASGAGETIEAVSPNEWVARLEKSAERVGEGDASVNSGVPLLEFYRSSLLKESERLPVLDTTFAREKSETLRHEVAMNEEWMGLWLKERFPDKH